MQTKPATTKPRAGSPPGVRSSLPIPEGVRGFVAFLLLALSGAPPAVGQGDGFTLSFYANAMAGEASLVQEDVHPVEEVFGFDGDTTYLGNTALQLQWRNRRHTILARLGAEDNGLSPYVDTGLNLEVAYYGLRVSDRVEFKLGRIEVPLGIFNQLRRVGALHPFSRVASDYYREGGPSTQSVDGLGVSLQGPWNSALDLFWGEYDFQEGVIEPLNFTAEDVIGGELRWKPQFGGVQLTFGVGYLQYTTSGTVLLPDTPHDREGYWGFLEVDADRYFLRAEGRVYEGNGRPELPPFGLFDAKFSFSPFYAEGGVKHGRWMAGLRFEQADVGSDLVGSEFVFLQDNRQRETTTLAVSRDVGRGFLVKLEHSWHRYGLVQEPELVDTGPPVRFETPTDLQDGRTVILTLSYATSWSFGQR